MADFLFSDEKITENVLKSEAEIWPFCARAVKIRNITLVLGTLWSLCSCYEPMRQISRSTECVSSSIKNQLKALSNHPNFVIYKEIVVKESNADVRIFFTRTA